MASKVQRVHNWWCNNNCCVADPDPRVLGLLDPDPDPLVRGMDLDLDHLTLSKNSKKTLDLYCFVTSFYRILRNYDVATL